MSPDLFHIRRLFGWWSSRTDKGSIRNQFVPTLEIMEGDGCVIPELLMVNNSNVTVWVEEATVVLSDLNTNWQTSIAPGQARREIHQNIPPRDSLAVSLTGAMYDAAGRPQGTYSFVLFADVRYRMGNEWFSKALDICWVEMAALTVLRLRRARWYDKYPKRNHDLAVSAAAGSEAGKSNRNC
jgi:hypothetical protein